MSATTAAALPTKTEIANWSNDHLRTAAEQWDKQADEAEQAFEQRRDNTTAPAGTEFKGKAADAAYDDAVNDLTIVRRQSQGLRDAATVARNGKQELDELVRGVIQAIQEAKRDGFNVSENLTVTTGHGGDGSATSNAAQQHQDFIRWRAGQLVAAEQRIAQELHLKADALDGGNGDPTVQMMGGHDKKPQFPPFDPLPKWEYDLDLSTGVKIIDDRTHPTSAGAGISMDDVYNELKRCFNCNFPIPGAPHDFPKVGDELPLHVGPGGVQGMPVKVTQIDKTSDAINIEFVTLPGHADGPGSTIHFTWHNQDGDLRLGVHSVVTSPGPGTEGWPLGPVIREGYRTIGWGTWQPYIDNVTRHIQEQRGHQLQVPVYFG
ncbi:hypothetical protein [Mycobacterium sp. D16R24]|uniref:hypothetical protein n=1 Tax=Mycobacterium sp. D16R24 TaxID=1855656 RepID=UPI00099377B8|nr:hypothetical protein [Mycobacterium sp. D16R24]